jgi:hypothetical protein
MDNRRNKPRVRPSTTSSAHHSQQVIPYCKYGIDESKTESSHVHMKLVTQVSEHQPIAMCSCRRPDETDFVRLFSLTSYFTPAPIEDSLHISMLSPPQNDRVLMVGPRPGRPCNSERAYEVYSSCSLRQARSYRSTCTHPSPCTLCRGAQLEMMDAAVKVARRGLAVISVRPSLPP